jgi:Ca2+-binding EF-hand superfamily protein
MISSAEFNSNLAGNFSKMDKNSNGAVDLAEFSQYAKEKRAEYKKKKVERRAEGRTRYFKKLDENGDGAISREEYIGKALKRAEEKATEKFAKLDGNDSDGKISQKEFLENRSHEGKKKSYSHADKKRGKGHSVEKMFSRMDANGDGKVTQKENSAERAKWFKRLDANNDGLVSSEELKEAREARKQNRH